MPRSYDVNDWIRAARQQEDVLEQQMNELSRRRTKLDAEQQAIAGRLGTAVGELLSALLPDGSAAAAAQAAQWTGYARLAQDPPEEAARREVVEHRARLAEIEKDPRYTERQQLRDPDIGTLTTGLRENEELLAPLDAALKRAEHPRLNDLIAKGYGTPDYDVPWWRLSYYRDWEAGDEILEGFSDYEEDFGRFRDYYLEIYRSAATLRGEVERLRGEIRAGRNLELEHGRLAGEIGTAPQRALQTARQQLRSFLEDLGPKALEGRIDPTTPLGLLALRWAGLRKQLDYLKELEVHLLDAKEKAWARELSKLRRKATKYRRPKKRYTRFSQAEFSRTFRDRSSRYAKHWRTYDTSFDAIRGFDRYHEGSLADDCLWWDTICDGRIKGKRLPSVASFRREHPDYAYRRPKRRAMDDEALAAAAIANADAPDDDGFDDYS